MNLANEEEEKVEISSVYEQHPYVAGKQKAEEEGIKSCLRNTRIIVRHLPK
jgi:hypothetical protein